MQFTMDDVQGAGPRRLVGGGTVGRGYFVGVGRRRKGNCGGGTVTERELMGQVGWGRSPGR